MQIFKFLYAVRKVEKFICFCLKNSSKDKTESGKPAILSEPHTKTAGNCALLWWSHGIVMNILRSQSVSILIRGKSVINSFSRKKNICIVPQKY